MEEDRSYPGKGGVWEEEEQIKSQNRRNRPHRPIGRCEEGRMGREPSNTHPEGEELGNHCHPLERGGVIGRGRPRSCKRRARRQPARQRRTPQLGRMHKPLARRTMERKEGKRRRRGGKEEEKEEKERRKQERKEEEEEEERRERRRKEEEKTKSAPGRVLPLPRFDGAWRGVEPGGSNPQRERPRCEANALDR